MPSFRGPRSGAGFRASGASGEPATYIAYLDEFGHIGPYIGRDHPKHNDSPVFGLAGFILPLDEVRGFATWFFQRKCDLLDFEIKQAGEHPAVWEKKWSSLYTVKNVTKHPELRKFTNRLFNKIATLDGFVFYVGIKKTAPVGTHNPDLLYRRILSEAIKRLDDFCGRIAIHRTILSWRSMNTTRAPHGSPKPHTVCSAACSHGGT